MDVLDRAFATARNRRARVVLPEMDDPRIALAAERLRAEGLAQPLTLADARPAEAYIEHLLKNRPGLKPGLALRMLEKPLIRAAAMVAAGEAEALVAGAANATRRVIEAAQLAIGMAVGRYQSVELFLIVLPMADPSSLPIAP